jgi:hypothetical protein
MVDRAASERLARALADELAHTAEQSVLDHIRALRRNEPWGSYNAAALAASDEWRELVWRALEVAELTER